VLHHEKGTTDCFNKCFWVNRLVALCLSWFNKSTRESESEAMHMCFGHGMVRKDEMMLGHEYSPRQCETVRRLKQSSWVKPKDWHDDTHTARRFWVSATSLSFLLVEPPSGYVQPLTRYHMTFRCSSSCRERNSQTARKRKLHIPILRQPSLSRPLFWQEISFCRKLLADQTLQRAGYRLASHSHWHRLD